jgi:hypothetical protein
LTYFERLDHKKKKYEFCEITLQNGGEIQDSAHPRMFNNSVNFHLNDLKLWI